MKKFLLLFTALMMLLLPCAALAETAPETPELWYELSAEDTVLTVRLPGNTKPGLIWSFEISNPEALELITHETIEGESEGMAGTPTTYVASFMTTAGIENNVSLILTCRDEANPTEPAAYTRVLDLNTAADNKLTINSVLVREPFAEWIEFAEDGYIMTVRMPDAAWSFEITDPATFELITCDDSDGAFVASFMSAMEMAGLAEIVFTSDDGLNQRVVDAFINESGGIFVNWVDVFEIFNPVEAPAAE